MEKYEQLYKDALERANAAYKDDDRHLKATLERIFPELAESEDERIRKDIIRVLKGEISYTSKEENEKYIAWLEKQGKLKSNKWTEGDVVRHGGILALVINGRRAMKSNYEQITIQYPDEWVKADSQERKHFFEELEKQSNQKPTEEVKTKFNVGDWVVFNDNHESIYQIEKKENFQYTLRHILGGSMPLSFSHENMIRLWNIKDIKDGDVISNGEMIVIFKHWEEPSYRQHIIAYIGLDINGDIQITDDNWSLGIDKAKPATKKQCDLLFSKMKEAGYEWNANKKELKKIIINPKFNEGDWIIGANNICKITSLNNDLNCYIAITSNNEEIKIPYYFDDGPGHMCCYHLWSVEDVKDGDILVYRNSATEIIMIFKCWSVNRKAAHTYFHIFDYDNYRINDSCDCGDSARPATKEERDTLFARMREAGYEWDANKKNFIK